jgi:hypothetical protein
MAGYPFSVIVHDFNVARPALTRRPLETDAPLLINANGVLTRTSPLSASRRFPGSARSVSSETAALSIDNRRAAYSLNAIAAAPPKAISPAPAKPNAVISANHPPDQKTGQGQAPLPEWRRCSVRFKADLANLD